MVRVSLDAQGNWRGIIVIGIIKAPSFALHAWSGLTSPKDWHAKLASIIGLTAMLSMTVLGAVQPTSDEANQVSTAPAAAASSKWSRVFLDPQRAIGAYGGIAHTQPAVLSIKKEDREVTVRDFDWIGKPFTNPIYYGARVWRWNPMGRFGHMVDFTHAKAIAKPDSVAKFTGSHNGKELPKSAPIEEVFNKLEFSHGHNMLTYNGLVRLGTMFGWIRPYFGVGAGVSLPHTEIGYEKDNVRTFEYQFAGFNGQALAGLEIDLGRTSLFLEYKFTYAPYDVPLSHTYMGDLLVTDLWRQFRAWWRGDTPPGGRLTVNLASHHGIAGVMVKTGPMGAYAQK